MCLLVAAPTSTHGVFTSFSLSQYCCLHFWKNKFGSMLAQGFLRVKGQAQITKCYFMWVDAINTQSLSGHYLMRQQVSMVFSLHLVYLSTAACISEKKNKVWAHVGTRIFKGQKSSKNHKMLLFVSWGNKFVIIEWPPFDAPSSTHGVFTSFILSRCCCLHFCRNKFGLMLAQRYFKGQRSRIIHIIATFYDVVWYAIIKW